LPKSNQCEKVATRLIPNEKVQGNRIQVSFGPMR
jgi:hypothetical protein